MLHINLDSCSSTQTYLKELIEKEPQKAESQILVTTKNQTSGKGRGENKWKHFSGSIAMSCILKAPKKVTFAPLLIGSLISDYFKQSHQCNLLLKWPNDLMHPKGEKLGGIICQLVGEKIIVGIGINNKVTAIDTSLNFTFNSLNLENENNNIEKEIYQFLNSNIENNFNLQDWNKKCIHLNQRVKIIDEFSEVLGTFKGVHHNGEAILEKDSKEIKVISGSLFLI